MVRRRYVFLAGLFAVLAMASHGFAQGGRSEINGTVSDQQKGILPGVNVTAINEDNGLQRLVVSASFDRDRGVRSAVFGGVLQCFAAAVIQRRLG